MLKLIHNRLVAKYALAFAGLIIAAYFAWNAYPIGEYSGKQFLADVPGGSAILGVIAALMMGVLVILLFFHKEYIHEDIKEYSRLRNDQRFLNAFKWFTWFVLALEFCSVAFRWYLLNWSRLGFVFLAIGVVGMALTYILGLVLHAVVNRPSKLAAAHLREEAGRQAFEDGEKHLGKLSTGQKRRVAGGDASPIDDVRDAKAQEREEEVAAVRRRRQQAAEEEAERQRIAEEEDRKNEEFYRQMIAPPIESPANNGKGKRPLNF